MSDSDDDIPLTQLKKKITKKGTPKSKASAADSDDDFVPKKRARTTKSYAESESDFDDDDDYEEKPAKKKSRTPVVKKTVKKTKSPSSAKAKSPASSRKSKSPGAKKSKPKSTSKIDTVRSVESKNINLPPLKQLELAIKSRTWWLDDPLPEGMRWRTLEHNGLMFPPPYEPHGVKLLYDGEPVDLTPEEEEAATFYAAMPLESEQLRKPEVAEMFNKNFFKDFREILGKDHIIKRFDKIDFGPIREHVEQQREVKRSATREEKLARKANEDAERLRYAFALVDGNLQRIGNIMVEPPGLFRGRGKHPKTGTIKRRVLPEQITLNLGEGAPIPKCPVPGHSWGRIVHKHDVTWLAHWKENVLGAHKYVWLSASSGFKGQSDLAKYEKARKLKALIPKIRADYEKNLTSSNVQMRQIATAMWIIDRLALRVGNEKNDEEEAETYGCCSLQVSHISLEEDGHKLTLDFLGKDSMQHLATYELEEQYGETGIQVFKNFQMFIKKKKPDQDVFDRINPSSLNDHLKTLMDGLSAKVFRTYNASITLEQQLPHTVPRNTSPQELLLIYNAANREVAILCNHQKTVTVAAEATLVKMKNLTEDTKKELNLLRKMLKDVKAGKELKLKSNTDDKEIKAKERYLFSKQPTVEMVKKRIKTWQEKIVKQEMALKNRNDNKSVALGTSKINYMDPRITVAWCKRNECPIEKVFATALRDKFPWAMSAKMDFKW